MPLNDETQNIIDATDVVALVSKYVKLEKQGKNYKGLCPFHNENTGSFIVSPDKKLAHCFGCGGGGTITQFLMQIENIDFPTCIAKLAEFNGIEYHGKRQIEKQNPNLKYFKIMQVATNFYKKYYEVTEDGKKAKEYLTARGLDEETIQAFNVGLAPPIGDTLYKVLKESDFLELDMADCGLIEKGVTGYYDLFSNRIMFPICDAEGHPVAFSGRIFNNKDKNQPKYINSRECQIFHKGETLFNLHNAKPDIMKKKRVILHEGQMDVIASYRSTLKEAICTLGTSLSDSHVKLLSRYTTSVVICYDGDGAGIRASVKAIKLFKKFGFTIHLVLLPDKMDPDEYVLKYGKEAYLDYFENNQMDSNQYIFETSILNQNLQDSNVREEVKREVFSLIQSMSSAMEAEEYINRFARVLNVSKEAVLQDFEGYRNIHSTPKAQDIYPEPQQYVPEPEYYPEYPYEDIPPVVEPKPVKRHWNSMCELRLFMYAKSSKTKAIVIDNAINESLHALSVDSQRLWITLINCFYENYASFDEAAFIKMLSNEDVDYYLEMLEALRGDKTPYSDEDMYECIEKLKMVRLDVDNRIIGEKIKSSTDVTEISRLIDEKLKNKRKKEQLKKSRRN